MRRRRSERCSSRAKSRCQHQIRARIRSRSRSYASISGRDRIHLSLIQNCFNFGNMPWPFIENSDNEAGIESEDEIGGAKQEPGEWVSRNGSS
ncbi:hypothetical protein AKJ16_DCAP05134 [Drosera capensis]